MTPNIMVILLLLWCCLVQTQNPLDFLRGGYIYPPPPEPKPHPVLDPSLLAGIANLPPPLVEETTPHHQHQHQTAPHNPVQPVGDKADVKHSNRRHTTHLDSLLGATVDNQKPPNSAPDKGSTDVTVVNSSGGVQPKEQMNNNNVCVGTDYDLSHMPPTLLHSNYGKKEYFVVHWCTPSKFGLFYQVDAPDVNLHPSATAPVLKSVGVSTQKDKNGLQYVKVQYSPTVWINVRCAPIAKNQIEEQNSYVIRMGPDFFSATFNTLSSCVCSRTACDPINQPPAAPILPYPLPPPPPPPPTLPPSQPPTPPPFIPPSPPPSPPTPKFNPYCQNAEAGFDLSPLKPVSWSLIQSDVVPGCDYCIFNPRWKRLTVSFCGIMHKTCEGCSHEVLTQVYSQELDVSEQHLAPQNAADKPLGCSDDSAQYIIINNGHGRITKSLGHKVLGDQYLGRENFLYTLNALQMRADLTKFSVNERIELARNGHDLFAINSPSIFVVLICEPKLPYGEVRVLEGSALIKGSSWVLYFLSKCACSGGCVHRPPVSHQCPAPPPLDNGKYACFNDYNYNGTNCLGTCGKGYKMVNHDQNSTNDATNVIECQPQPGLGATWRQVGDAARCELDCFTEWSNPGKCTVPCNGGVSLRTREYKDVPTKYECMAKYSNHQPDVLKEWIRCNAEPCQCHATPWTDWSACKPACTMTTSDIRTKLRTRAYIHPKAVTYSCVEVLGGPEAYLNYTMQFAECLSNPCPLGNCTIGQWSAWTPCTVPCEGGLHSRTRKMPEDPRCDLTTHISEEVRTCNVGPCPPPPRPLPLPVPPSPPPSALPPQTSTPADPGDQPPSGSNPPGPSGVQGHSPSSPTSSIAPTSNTNPQLDAPTAASTAPSPSTNTTYPPSRGPVSHSKCYNKDFWMCNTHVATEFPMRIVNSSTPDNDGMSENRRITTSPCQQHTTGDNHMCPSGIKGFIVITKPDGSCYDCDDCFVFFDLLVSSFDETTGIHYRFSGLKISSVLSGEGPEQQPGSILENEENRDTDGSPLIPRYRQSLTVNHNDGDDDNRQPTKIMKNSASNNNDNNLETRGTHSTNDILIKSEDVDSTVFKYSTGEKIQTASSVTEQPHMPDSTTASVVITCDPRLHMDALVEDTFQYDAQTHIYEMRYRSRCACKGHCPPEPMRPWVPPLPKLTPPVTPPSSTSTANNHTTLTPSSSQSVVPPANTTKPADTPTNPSSAHNPNADKPSELKWVIIISVLTILIACGGIAAFLYCFCVKPRSNWGTRFHGNELQQRARVYTSNSRKNTSTYRPPTASNFNRHSNIEMRYSTSTSPFGIIAAGQSTWSSYDIEDGVDEQDQYLNSPVVHYTLMDGASLGSNSLTNSTTANPNYKYKKFNQRLVQQVTEQFPSHTQRLNRFHSYLHATLYGTFHVLYNLISNNATFRAGGCGIAQLGCMVKEEFTNNSFLDAHDIVKGYKYFGSDFFFNVREYEDFAASIAAVLTTDTDIDNVTDDLASRLLSEVAWHIVHSNPSDDKLAKHLVYSLLMYFKSGDCCYQDYNSQGQQQQEQQEQEEQQQQGPKVEIAVDLAKHLARVLKEELHENTTDFC